MTRIRKIPVNTGNSQTAGYNTLRHAVILGSQFERCSFRVHQAKLNSRYAIPNVKYPNTSEHKSMPTARGHIGISGEREFDWDCSSTDLVNSIKLFISKMNPPSIPSRLAKFWHKMESRYCTLFWRPSTSGTGARGM